MYSLINKINFYHSIIFFIYSCFIALIVNRFENLIISPVVCLFFILSIGISHGALDDQKGKKLTQLYNIKNSYFFYLMYSVIVIGIITFWLLFPTISLIIFLIVASFHFGKEDTEFLLYKKNKPNIFFYFFIKNKEIKNNYPTKLPEFLQPKRRYNKKNLRGLNNTKAFLGAQKSKGLKITFLCWLQKIMVNIRHPILIT